ncbi:MAG: radical SAM family heme chaperone HemW [Bdellovibrionales bacterium]
MALAVYVHIPYCLQRCRYCDFTTFEQSEILPAPQYVQWLLQEIRQRRHLWTEDTLSTIYFGGGTPSLLTPDLIVSICQELAKVGLRRSADAEQTIEINPATLDESKLNSYLEAGFNRFSVGAQTFDEALLKTCGRRHSAEDTRSTLRLLQKYKANYSFDLLFALPGQTLQGLARDLDEVLDFAPPHLSAYCLTVPTGHPMNQGRAPDSEQVEMFDLIESRLKSIQLERYEISNFARAGFESRHNMAYWRDLPFWGLGLSAHSYNPSLGPWGSRFWNPKAMTEYERQVPNAGPHWKQVLAADQIEELALHESLTDFLHMHLRTQSGASTNAMKHKYPDSALRVFTPRLEKTVRAGLVEVRKDQIRLTQKGVLLSNKVFEEFTFLAPDLLQRGTLTPAPRAPYCAL